MSHKAQDELSAALRQVFTLDSFADGMAGACGGVSAITVFYPLNIIRTKLQTDDPNKQARGMLQVCQDIINEDGWMGMFTGWWGQVVALGVSNFVYFYCYNMLKVIVQKKTKMALTPFTNLAVGAGAGVINVLLTTPLWMVSTQLAVQAKNDKASSSRPYTGMMDGLVTCFKAEGIEGLWKGLVPNLALVSNPMIQFFAYERIRMGMSKIADARGSKINSSEFFLMGALAKAIATVATYPIQVAQSQLRADRKSSEGKRKYSGTMDCLVKIIQAGGMHGLFRGMWAKLWQTVLTAAFQFMTYERMRVLVFKALTGKELKGFKSSH
jgi:adenine nucleotide transporter 17